MSEPFVTILHDSGRPELWLVTRDAHGCIVPVGSTGPVSLPSAWQAELERARTDHIRSVPGGAAFLRVAASSSEVSASPATPKQE